MVSMGCLDPLPGAEGSPYLTVPVACRVGGLFRESQATFAGSSDTPAPLPVQAWRVRLPGTSRLVGAYTFYISSIYSYLPHLLEMWLCKIFKASQACRHIQFGINLRAKHHERRERRLEQIRKPIAGPK